MAGRGMGVRKIGDAHFLFGERREPQIETCMSQNSMKGWRVFQSWPFLRPTVNRGKSFRKTAIHTSFRYVPLIDVSDTITETSGEVC